MKKNHVKRAVSLTVAAVMTCTLNFPSSAADLLSALPEQQRMIAAASCSSDEPVPVIITLNSDGILDGETDAEYLETSEAASEADALQSKQDAVIAKIRKLYPALEVRYRYTALMNGFSCSIPENLIEQIKKMPAVSNVSVTENTEIKVESSPFDTPELPTYYDATGCTGEGKVIAVIDTELDVTHPMFAPLADGIETKLKKSDIEAIQNGIGFQAEFTADQAYYSSKIPFAINYCYDPDDLADRDNYHGTHVCGVAAGNRIKNAEGREIHGVAPDAQIVFMKIDLNIATIAMAEEVIIAALEDAVKLNVDAINISFGVTRDPLEDNVFADVINQAAAAGITVCIAAGNSDNGQVALKRTRFTDNPDVSTMNTFTSEGTQALSVASANNPTEKEYRTLMHNGSKMLYGCFYDSDLKKYRFLGDELEKREYEYEYCGYGYDEDFEGKDLTGKLALLERGEIYFWEKASAAQGAGAVGVIIVQNTAEPPSIMSSDTDLAPLAMVSAADGQILKNAEVKTVSFTDEEIHVAVPTEVSDYTSWGVHSSLELRPDIMGIGGTVESAAYDAKTEVLSGTSMASPYIAGCSAILKQYLLQNGCTLTGTELTRYIRNLMMTGAAPLTRDDMYITPRRQGAGFVNLNTSINSKILLTGAEGETKLNLRDKLGTQFTFPLTLTNISNEDVAFSSAQIALTTDNYQYHTITGNNQILGQQPLNCTADFGDITQIAAGETKTVDVTVTLDAAQAAELKKAFVYGFFIDGYLLLSGAENCPDISVPMTGFSDNFSQIPAFNDTCYVRILSDYTTTFDNTVPFCELMEMYTTALDRISEEEPEILQCLPEEACTHGTDDYHNVSSVMDYITDEEKDKEFSTKTKPIYCSPNNDGIAENFLVYPDTKRFCYVTLDITDENGNVLKEITANMIDSKIPAALFDFNPFLLPDNKLDTLKEGKYWVRLKGTLHKNASEEDTQYYSIPMYIDNTVPEIKQTKKEVDGRQILELTASDSCALDGIVLLGKGSGNPVGSSRPMQSVTGMAARETFRLAFSTISRSTIKPQYAKDKIDYASLPPFMQGLLNRNSDESNAYFDWFTYMDFMPVKQDGDKTLTVSYDITDLEDYDIIVLDRAFNMNTLSKEAEVTKRGDVDCSGSVDVADAVLLARYLAEDADAFVREQGKLNADCDGDTKRTQNDVVMILQAIARIIKLDA